MVSFNNTSLKRQLTADQEPVYGLRKLSMGFGSVLLGTMMYAGLNNTVHADTLPVVNNNNVNSTGENAVAQTAASQATTISAPVANQVTSAPAVSTASQAPVSQPVTTNTAVASSTPVASQNFTVANVNGGANYQVTPSSAPVVDWNQYQVNSNSNNQYQVGFKDQSYAGNVTLPNTADVQAHVDNQQAQVVWQANQNADLSQVNTLKISNTDNQKLMMTDNGMNDFKQMPNVQKLDLSGVDASKLTNLDHAFSNLNQLKEVNLDGWQGKNVVSAKEMFANNPSLQKVNGKFDLSNVSSVAGMFKNTPNLLNVSLSAVKTSHKLTDMHDMFNNSGVKSIDLTDWKTNKVTDMSGMLANTKNLQEVKGLNEDKTEAVTDLHNFANGSALKTADLNQINGQNVENMHGMLANMPNLTKVDGLKNFGYQNSKSGVSKVTDLSAFVQNDENLNRLDLSGFRNTENLKSLGQAFENTGLSELNLSKLNPSQVVDMHKMAANNENLLAVALGKNFDAKNVQNLNEAFANNPKLSTFDLSNFKTGNQVKSADQMFANTPALVALTGLNGIQQTKDTLAGVNKNAVDHAGDALRPLYAQLNVNDHAEADQSPRMATFGSPIVFPIASDGTSSQVHDIQNAATITINGKTYKKSGNNQWTSASGQVIRFEPSDGNLVMPDGTEVPPSGKGTQTTVLPDPNADKTATTTLHFVDDDYQAGMTNKNGQSLSQEVATWDISGNVNKPISISGAELASHIPAGYKITSDTDIPSSIVPGDPRNTTTIHLSHKLDKTTSAYPFNVEIHLIDESTGKDIANTGGNGTIPSGTTIDEVTGKSTTTGKSYTVQGIGNFAEKLQSWTDAGYTVTLDEGRLDDQARQYLNANHTGMNNINVVANQTPSNLVLNYYFSVKKNSQQQGGSTTTPSKPTEGKTVIKLIDIDYKPGMKDVNGSPLNETVDTYTVTSNDGSAVNPNIKDHLPHGYELADTYPSLITPGHTPEYDVKVRHIIKRDSQMKHFVQTIVGVNDQDGSQIFKVSRTADYPLETYTDEVTNEQSVKMPDDAVFGAQDIPEQVAEQGWVADQDNLPHIPEQKITPSTPADQTITLKYHMKDDSSTTTPGDKDEIKVHIEFVDLDDGDGQVIASKDITNIKAGSKIPLQTLFNSMLGGAYKLDPTDDLVMNNRLNDYTVTDNIIQNIAIGVHHSTNNKSESRTIYRRIYVYDATTKENKLVDTQSATTSRQEIKDLVDDSNSHFTPWSKISFASADSSKYGSNLKPTQIPELTLDNDQIDGLSQADDGKYYTQDVVLNPATNNVTVDAQFVDADDDDSPVGFDYKFTGPQGSTVNWQDSYPIPNGYELDSSAPKTITLDKDGSFNIKVHHVKSGDLSNDPDYVDEANQTVTRVINFVDEDGNELKPSITQKEVFHRTVYIDSASQKLMYGPWKLQAGSTNDKVAQFDEVKPLEIDGYTVNEQSAGGAPQQKIDLGDLDSYDGQEVDIIYDVKKGAKPSTPSKPKTITDTHTVTQDVYVQLGDQQPKKIGQRTATIKRTGQQDPLTGKTTWGEWSNATLPVQDAPEEKGYVIPDTESSVYDEQVITADTPERLPDIVFKYVKDNDGKGNQPVNTEVHSSKTVIRDLYVQLGNDDLKKIDSQSATITRSGHKDANGNITWGPWSSAQLPAFKAPTEAGYHLDKADNNDPINVDGNTAEHQKAVMHFVKDAVKPDNPGSDKPSQPTDDGKVKIDFVFVDVDNGNEPIDDGIYFNTRPGTTVRWQSLMPVPDGYELAGVTSPVYIAKDKSETVKIPLRHMTKDVTGDPAYQQHTKELTWKVIGRMHDQSGAVTRTMELSHQTIKSIQEATYDLVTKQVTYGNWKIADGSFTPVTVGEIKGYHLADGQANTLAAPLASNQAMLSGKESIKDSYVDYVADKSSQQPSTKPDNPSDHGQHTDDSQKKDISVTLQFVYNGQIVGEQTETRSDGTKEDINYHVPDGYKVASGAKGLTLTFNDALGAQSPLQVQVVPVKSDGGNDHGHPTTGPAIVHKLIQYVDRDSGQIVSSSDISGEQGFKTSINLKLPAGYQSDQKQVAVDFSNSDPIKVTVWKIDSGDDHGHPTTGPAIVHKLIQYVDRDSDQIVSSSDISGEQGSKTSINLKLPAGYQSDQKQVAVDFSNSDPIKVTVWKANSGQDDHHENIKHRGLRYVNEQGETVATRDCEWDLSKSPTEYLDHDSLATSVPAGYQLADKYQNGLTFGFDSDEPINVLVVKNDSGDKDDHGEKPSTMITKAIMYVDEEGNVVQRAGSTEPLHATKKLSNLQLPIPKGYQLADSEDPNQVIHYDNEDAIIIHVVKAHAIDVVDEIQYLNPQGEVIKTDKVSGKAGTSKQVKLQAPEGYELFGDDTVTLNFVANKPDQVNVNVKPISSELVTETINYLDLDTHAIIAQVKLQGYQGAKLHYHPQAPSGYVLLYGDDEKNFNERYFDGKTIAIMVAPDHDASRHINFIDENGKQVGRQTVSIHKNFKPTVDLQVPTGYHLASGQVQRQINFDPFTDKAVTITVVKNGSSAKPQQPTTTEAKVVINYVDTANHQVVGSQMVTGKKGVAQTVNLQVPKGYIAKNQQIQVTPDNQTVVVNVNKESQEISRNIIFLVNGNTIVGRQTVTGEKGQTMPVNLTVPDGYHVLSGNNQVNIKLDTTNDFPVAVARTTAKTTIDFVDHDGNKVGSQSVEGPEGKQVKLHLNVPKGYQVAYGDGSLLAVYGQGEVKVEVKKIDNGQSTSQQPESQASASQSSTSQAPAISDNAASQSVAASRQAVPVASQVASPASVTTPQAIAGGVSASAPVASVATPQVVNNAPVAQPMAQATTSNVQLPQTGNHASVAMIAFGLATLSFGFGLLKRKQMN